MKLTLSSAAAPDATLAELAIAARRRGLRALELMQGHAHRLIPPDGAPSLAGAVGRGHGLEVVALRFVDLASARRCIGVAAELGAAVVVPGMEVVSAPAELAALLAAGVTPLLAFREPERLVAAAAQLAVADEAVGFAWDVQPGGYDLAAAAESVLQAVAGRLRHLHLYGGGPESVAQEGLGVGALMRQLALAGFTGSLAIGPSDERYRVVWNAWLGRRGGWGCGGKANERQSLPTATQEAG